MSYADKVFIKNMKDILKHGVWDKDQQVRPKWLDGTPAHTIKKFCIVYFGESRPPISAIVCH